MRDSGGAPGKGEGPLPRRDDLRPARPARCEVPVQIAPILAHVAFVRAPVLPVVVEITHVRASVLPIAVQIAEVAAAVLEVAAQAAARLLEILARGLDRVGVAGLVGVAQLLARAAQRGAVLPDVLGIPGEVLLVAPDVPRVLPDVLPIAADVTGVLPHVSAILAQVLAITCHVLGARGQRGEPGDRKSTRLNSSHSQISYAVFCLN